MPKLRDLIFKPPHVINYGVAGSGKTALMLTLGDRLVVLDHDGGCKTGLKLQDKWTNERLKVEVKDCTESDIEQPTAFSKSLSYVKSFAAECRKKTFKYRAVGVDSLTTLFEHAMGRVLVENNRLFKIPQIQHWGMAFCLITNYIAILRSLPMVVVINAHQDRYEEDSETRIAISIPGKKLPARIPAFFDEVWRSKINMLEGNKKAYVLQTKGTSSVPARSRSNLRDNLNTDIGMVEVLKLLGYDIDANTKKGVKDGNHTKTG